MGRFDALTTLYKKPAQQAPLPEKTEPVQPAPLPKDYMVSKPTNQQTMLPANLQARKDANLQTGKQVSQQTVKLVSLQTGQQVFIEKYSSYLPHEYKKELKRIALESDRNEYDVLIEVVGHYLTQQKQLK